MPFGRRPVYAGWVGLCLCGSAALNLDCGAGGVEVFPCGVMTDYCSTELLASSVNGCKYQDSIIKGLVKICQNFMRFKKHNVDCMIARSIYRETALTIPQILENKWHNQMSV